VDETEAWALRFFEAFHSIGTGTALIEAILDRGDWNSTPESRILTDRSDYSAATAPDVGESGGAAGDFAD
jgi:hypothetical protein